MRVTFNLEDEFSCNDEDQMRGYYCQGNETSFSFSHCCAAYEADSEIGLPLWAIVIIAVGGLLLVVAIVWLIRRLVRQGLREEATEKATEPIDQMLE